MKWKKKCLQFKIILYRVDNKHLSLFSFPHSLVFLLQKVDIAKIVSTGIWREL